MGLDKTRSTCKNQTGFTIVEFMIATAIFSLVLMLCALAILHVGRMFYKGVITNRVQDVARKTAEDLADNIRFGTGSTDPSIFFDDVNSLSPVTFVTGATSYLRTVCLGTSRFTFSSPLSMAPADGTTQMLPMGSSSNAFVPIGLWKDRRDNPNGACVPLDLTDALAVADSRNRLNGQELLTGNMRVSRFSIIEAPTDGSLWEVNVRISYGAEDGLFPDGALASRCVGSEAGGQFCAVSEISTFITKRL